MPASKSLINTIPYKILWETLDFNFTNKAATTSDLNIISGNINQFRQLISSGDAFYEQQVQRTASAILKQPKQIRVIIIAGPSSSGKTTTTHKLAAILKFMAGITFKPLELDNYFNVGQLPKDIHGDTDYERPSCLDVALINQHLERLLKGEEVKIPSYNFKTATRTLEVTPLRLEDNEILLLDSLHGLSPEITAAVPEDQKLKLYLEPFCQIKDGQNEYMRWSDLRLLRRMSRDRLYRNCNPAQTLGHWHYVRAAEKAYILPNISNADIIINGALPYELPFLKSIIWPYLDHILQIFRLEKDREDAIKRGERLYRLLAEVNGCENIDLVPPDSLLREFIGNSAVINQ